MFRTDGDHSGESRRFPREDDKESRCCETLLGNIAIWFGFREAWRHSEIGRECLWRRWWQAAFPSRIRGTDKRKVSIRKGAPGALQICIPRQYLHLALWIELLSRYRCIDPPISPWHLSDGVCSSLKNNYRLRYKILRQNNRLDSNFHASTCIPEASSTSAKAEQS